MENPRRGVCDALQEALERYVETTGEKISKEKKVNYLIFVLGNQLAEAMKVSYSQELGERLQKEPFKTMGENGIRSSIKVALEKKSTNVEEIFQDLGTWGSGWLLKACADDKQPAMGGPPGGGMPPNMDMEAMKAAFEAQQKEQNL